MQHSEGLHLIAERYVRLAETSSDPAERLKFFEYASAYEELSEQGSTTGAIRAPRDFHDCNGGGRSGA